MQRLGLTLLVGFVDFPVGGNALVADFFQLAGRRLGIGEKVEIRQRQPVVTGVVADVFRFVEQHGRAEALATGAAEIKVLRQDAANECRVLGVHHVLEFFQPVFIDSVTEDETVGQERVTRQGRAGFDRTHNSLRRSEPDRQPASRQPAVPDCRFRHRQQTARPAGHGRQGRSGTAALPPRPRPARPA